MTPPLFGLVLSGGASTRMQRDKAALAYHGRSQLQWSFDLLSQVCTATFVSVRPDQREEATRAPFAQIVDRQPGTGPIAGISAALLEHPKAAWLVVACDLPFLAEATLRHLIAHRDPHRIATAYRSSHDSLPEPLCAIWEPAARDPVLAYIAGGKQCPRKFLINSDVLLLDLPDARALDNVNTREELAAATKMLGEGDGLGAAGGNQRQRPHPVPPPPRGGGDVQDRPRSSSQDGRSPLDPPPSYGGEDAQDPPRSSSQDRRSPLDPAPSYGGEDAQDRPRSSSQDGRSSLDPPPSYGGGDAQDRPRSSSQDGRSTLDPPPSYGGGDAQDRPRSSSQDGRSPLDPPPSYGGGQGGGAPTSAGSKTVRIQYYAILREQAGRSEETLDTRAATPAALYEELRRRHPFQLSSSHLKVALNSEFSDWQAALKHGDTVVFIPPVAGG